MIVSQIPNKKIKDRREKLTENVKLYQAAASDIEEITALYEQAKGSKFCTWDEHYPNTEITRGDLERDALFCMKTETGEIVGAISIDDDKEVENLECWSKTLKPSVEIARLVVRTPENNSGQRDKRCSLPRRQKSQKSTCRLQKSKLYKSRRKHAL